MTDTLTPKQALSALSALDNAMAVLCDGGDYSRYSRRTDGLVGAPTIWETEALFRLRIALLCMARPAMFEQAGVSSSWSVSVCECGALPGEEHEHRDAEFTA